METAIIQSRPVGRKAQPKTELGKHLMNLRITQGITQAELAAQIGVDQGSYSRYEANGYLPGLEIVQRLANALHVSIGHLTLSEVDPRTQQPNRFTPLVEKARNLPRADQERIATVLAALIDQAQSQRQNT